MTESKSFSIFFWATLVALGFIYCIGMQLSLMDVDASQYALMSKEMFYSGNYLQVLERGKDYLDKPPLIFWTACLSFKVFGVHDWAYRLPSVLCLILGIYSLYRFCKLYYDEQTAKIAVLIMASCCASYLMTNDVRTDTMLTGWVMFSIWQIAEFNISSKFKNILLGSIGVGLAMLTKGPIGLIIPVVAFSVEFMYKRQWRSFFRWQYLVALIVIAIMLLPMSYGLYEQYDAHPEKTQYGFKSISGLRFFYWTQSFGRITGENTWNNSPDPFFLVHSFCWSFLPWTAFFFPAIFVEVKNRIKTIKDHSQPEAISIGGFLLVFLFLSRSKYQLPHYTFPLHPLAAVFTATYLSRNFTIFKSGVFSVFRGLHIFVMFAIYAGIVLLTGFVFPGSVILYVVVTLSFICFLYILFNKKIAGQNKMLFSTIILSITLAITLNANFYPNLLSYQASSEIAKDLNKAAISDSKLLIFKTYAPNSTMFYCDLPIMEYIDENSLSRNLVKGKTYIMADSVDIKTVQLLNPQIIKVKDYDNFGVTHLNIRFLNPSTRGLETGKMVLFKY